MLRVSIFSIICTIVAVCCAVAYAGDLRLYQIGNSHTWDAHRKDGFVQLVASAGLGLDNGYHIRCSKPLSYIANNPDEVCVEPNTYGTWVPALSEHSWDAVTFQSHTGSIGVDELDAVRKFSSSLNSYESTRILLLINWPSIAYREFREGWAVRYGSSEQASIQSKQYFIWLHKLLLESDLSSNSVEFIPVGAVMAELDKRFRNNEFPPLTRADDLYRDDLHLNNVGRYVLALTMLRVLYQYDVRDLGQIPFSFEKISIVDFEIDQEMADYLQRIVHQVTLEEPFDPDKIPYEMAFKKEGEQIEFSFRSYLGYEYFLLESLNLKDWSVRAHFDQGDGSLKSFQDEASAKFYKILRF